MFSCVFYTHHWLYWNHLVPSVGPSVPLQFHIFKITEQNLSKLHSKIEHNEKNCSAQEPLL